MHQKDRKFQVNPYPAGSRRQGFCRIDQISFCLFCAFKILTNLLQPSGGACIIFLTNGQAVDQIYNRSCHDTNSGKEEPLMNVTVNIGWKFILALGAVIVPSILAIKLDADAAERVSIHAIDATRDTEIAIHRSH